MVCVRLIVWNDFGYDHGIGRGFPYQGSFILLRRYYGRVRREINMAFERSAGDLGPGRAVAITRE